MENLKDLLEESYGMEVLDIEKIKNVYKVKAKDGHRFFKSSRYDMGQFGFIIAALEHLQKSGFKSVLPIYPTLDDRKFIQVGEGYGFLGEWLEDSREANFKNPVELKLCVETLSDLHIKSRGFIPPQNSGIRNYYGRWTKRFKKRCDELVYFKALIKSKDELTEFDNLFLKSFDAHYKQALKSIKDLEESSYIEIMKNHKELGGLCHHDTANHNFLITDDISVYMIDFDYCIFDSHLHDLSSIVIRNLKYGNWDFDRLQFILDIYGQTISVSDDEKYLIFCFMEFPQDFWQVGLQYYVEKQPWGEDFFLRKLGRIVGDSRERMEFIEEFRAILGEVKNV